MKSRKRFEGLVTRVRIDSRWLSRTGRPMLVLILASSFPPGCDSPTEAGPPPPAPGLHIIAGADVTDTIDAVLPGELQVELRDSAGAPWAGVPIRFEGAYEYATLTRVARTDVVAFTYAVVDTTDATGRAAARVRLGERARVTEVTIEAVGSGQPGVSASYTVLPGAPVHLTVAPEDTTLYRGNHYALESAVWDRHGNLREDGVMYSTGTPALARVDSVGRVDAVAIGRAVVRVSAAGMFDSVFVSIPPEGVFTAARILNGNPHRLQIVSMNLDGSGATSVVEVEASVVAGFSWNAAGTDLAFAAGGHDTDLYRRTGSGTVPLLESASPLQSMAFPRYSLDGQWVYFNGRPDHQNSEIWRVRADGSNPERVGPAATYYTRDTSPDPSPDGTRVAYCTDRVANDMPVIRILDLATRSVSEIDVPGVTPRWSPDGTALAYIATRPSWGYLEDSRAMNGAGFLSVMNPDGSGQRVIPTGTKQWAAHFGFSPDGKYIIAVKPSKGLELIELLTGATIPLSFTEGMVVPEWIH